ncbi:MAG: hypothetical protein E7369_04345, partial [Clostridiales bacterium]|nr:hypothetical protein [Clostridiales bacterium]
MKRTKNLFLVNLLIVLFAVMTAFGFMSMNNAKPVSADDSIPTEFSMENLGSVRLSGDSGIRFLTNVPKTVYAENLANAEDGAVEYGTLFLPALQISEQNPLSLDNLYDEVANPQGAVKAVTKNFLPAFAPSNQYSSYYAYVSALTEIPKEAIG